MWCKHFVFIIFLVVSFRYGTNEKNESINGVWKRLFVSKDGSTMSPYSLLMLNHTNNNDVPICSQDLQLNDDVNVDFCITPELINWESNPPNKVAVTHTNIFGEILKIIIFNNSGEYETTSRDKWFNVSSIVDEYSGKYPKNTNLRLFRRNFVMSGEELLSFRMTSMSVEMNISSFIPIRWHHLISTAIYRDYVFHGLNWYGTYCYRDVNQTLDIAEEDCVRSGSENCYVCCNLLGMNFALLKYNYTHYICSCTAEWPKETSINYFELPSRCEGICSNTSFGFCYYVKNTQEMFIVEDTVYTYSSEKKYGYEYMSFSYDENRIIIQFDSYQGIFCGVSFYSSILYPEWILQYNTSSILTTSDYWTSPSYNRTVIAKFLRDVKGRVYTKLDFGPIMGKQISLQPSNDVNLAQDIEFHDYYFQKNAWTNLGEDDYFFYRRRGFIHAPYLILQGFWMDSYFNTTETLDPFVTTEVSTFGSGSLYDLTSSEITTETPYATSIPTGIDEAYSVTQNGLSYQCKCFPEPNITLTVDVVEGIKEQIKSNLTVETDSLSSKSRKKNSAQDDRSSSRTIGCFGIILLSLELALLIFLDSTYFIRAIHDLYQKLSLVGKK